MFYSEEVVKRLIERQRGYDRAYRQRQQKKKIEAAVAAGLPLPPIHGNTKFMRQRTQEEKDKDRRAKDRERKRRQRKALKATIHTTKRGFPQRLRLATDDEVTKVTSWFALHDEGNHREYVLYLSKWELYSVKENAIHKHGRHILDRRGKNGTTTKPKGRGGTKVWVVIEADEKQRLRQYDMLHVVREGAEILKNFTSGVYKDGKLGDVDFSVIVNGLYTDGVGEGDELRSPDSRLINLSYHNTGSPISTTEDAIPFLTEVGKLAEFVCETMVILQDEAIFGREIFNDDERDFNFARRLRLRLHLDENSPMKAEMIAVCVMKSTGTCPRNNKHRDIMNPTDTENCRSGTFVLY